MLRPPKISKRLSKCRASLNRPQHRTSFGKEKKERGSDWNIQNNDWENRCAIRSILYLSTSGRKCKLFKAESGTKKKFCSERVVDIWNSLDEEREEAVVVESWNNKSIQKLSGGKLTLLTMELDVRGNQYKRDMQFRWKVRIAIDCNWNHRFIIKKE